MNKYDWQGASIDGLIAVWKHGKYGFLNDECVEIMPPIFDRIYAYQAVIIVVKNDVSLGIDKDFNYYDEDTQERIECEKCPCYNDYTMTKLCCKFKGDL